jgi:hypothetical protein
MRNVRSGFWVALGIALLVTAHAYWDLFESRRVRTRLQAVAATGAPTRPLTAPWLTAGPAADADRYYRAASVLAGPVRPPAPPEPGLQGALRDGRWTPDLLPALRARIDEQRDALALIDRAAPLPFEGFQLGWRWSYGPAGFITLSRLCELRAVERTLAGDGDGAFESLYSDVRLERVIGRAPVFSGLAFVVARAKPSAASRARLAEALREIDRDDRLQESLIRLRAQLFDMRSQTIDSLPWLVRPWISHAFVNQLDLFADLISAARGPRRFEAVTAIGRFPNPPPFTLSADKSRERLESFVKGISDETERIRCARRLVAGEMVNCSTK